MVGYVIDGQPSVKYMMELDNELDGAKMTKKNHINKYRTRKMRN